MAKEKLMPLDLLSSIKGARSSEAVEELFKVIRGAVSENSKDVDPETIANAVGIDSLRSDRIEKCPDTELQLIRNNFPREKNGFLVVPKVIED